MKATDTLMQEHELILDALAVLGRVTERIAGGGGVPEADVIRLLDFFRDYADAFHHAKEERLLFPAMVAAGLAESDGPIAMMLQEHEEGRALVQRMREALPRIAGDVEARRRFVDGAEYFRGHLDQHIQKENQVLFRIAEQVLGGQAGRDLDEAFALHALAQPPGLPLHFHSLVQDLSSALTAA